VRGACVAMDHPRSALAQRCGGILARSMSGSTLDANHVGKQGD
jgi:hypothetical protein